MIAVCPNPFASRALRIAATWPSIIALGATMSAPARAWLTADLGEPRERRRRCRRCRRRRAGRSGRDRCTRTGTCRRSSRSAGRARGCGGTPAARSPSSADASDPSASFASGRPNRMTPPTPRSASRAASSAATSGDIRWTPGIDPIGSRTPEPGWTKSGATSIDGSQAGLADQCAEGRRSPQAPGTEGVRRAASLGGLPGGASRSSVMRSPGVASKAEAVVRARASASWLDATERSRNPARVAASAVSGPMQIGRDRGDVEAVGRRERSQPPDRRTAREHDRVERALRHRLAQQRPAMSPAPPACDRRPRRRPRRRGLEAGPPDRDPRGRPGRRGPRSPSVDRQLRRQGLAGAAARDEVDLDPGLFEDRAGRRADGRPAAVRRARWTPALPPRGSPGHRSRS